MKSAVGQVIALIYSSNILFICYDYHMRSISSSVLANPVANFLGSSIYSESPSLSPELVAKVTSLSGLEVILGVSARPYFGRARFELILPLVMDADVAVSEAVVLVRMWAACAAPEQASKVGHPSPSRNTEGVNDGTSGGNMTWMATWQRIGEASEACDY